MNQYFRILELDDEADQRAVKKAYFRLLRKYPPDTHPEQFKKIRKAYEYLMNDTNFSMLKKGVAIPSEFQKAYYQILEYEKQNDILLAIALCEEILNIEEIQEIQCMLGQFYLQTGKSGKAVKLFEQLCKNSPGNMDIQAGLAEAYVCRGWLNKAFDQCCDLKKNGFNSLRICAAYAACIQKRGGSIEDGSHNLRQALASFRDIRHKQQIDRTHIGEVILFEFELEQQFAHGDISLMASLCLPFFEIEASEGEQMGEHLRECILRIYECLVIYSEDVKPIETQQQLIKEYRKITKALSCYFTGMMQVAFIAIQSRDEYLFLKMDADIHKYITQSADFFYKVSALNQFNFNIPGMKTMSESEQEMTKYDILLYWAEHLEILRLGFVKIKEKYPVLTELLGDYLEEFIHKPRKLLKDSYGKTYKKLMGYPLNMPLTLMEDELELTETYRRELPKIGRNDLCPCGSGQKYKKCCGK